MKYEFEKREEFIQGFSRASTKNLLKDFANGNTQYLWQWLQKEEPAHWQIKNKGAAPQLTYERLKATKEAIKNISGRSWNSDRMRKLSKQAAGEINDFMEKLNSELDRIAKRSDIDTQNNMFKYPLTPLPEPYDSHKKQSKTQANAILDDTNENSRKTETISIDDIWEKYWDLRNAGKKREYAFEKVSQWLLDELKFTKKEIKNRFNITLTMENFCRSATNNKP